MSRFSFPDRSPDFDDLMSHVQDVTIRLMRCRDGAVGIEFELKGGFLPLEDDDEGAPKDARKLACKVLREFWKGGGR